MGTCLSGDATAAASSAEEQQDLLTRFADLRTALHLKKHEFIRMYKYFTEANLNGDGCIQLDEFLAFFDASKSRFTLRVYDMFRDDNADGITFKQWVFGLWNFCTTDSDALILFGFQLYDKGGKGLLDLNDVKHMMIELFGKDYESNGLAKDLLRSLLETDYKGNPTTTGVTASRFAKVCTRAKNILYPAFQLQHKVRHLLCNFRGLQVEPFVVCLALRPINMSRRSQIQSRIFSEHFWHDKTEQRLQLQRDGRLDIREVLNVLDAGRRRADAHVVRGGIIMPYVSARGASESAPEKAERERMERLTSIVGGDEMTAILGKGKKGRVSMAPDAASGEDPAAGESTAASRDAESGCSSTVLQVEAFSTNAVLASPMAGKAPGMSLGRRNRARVSPAPGEQLDIAEGGQARGDGTSDAAGRRTPVLLAKSMESDGTPSRTSRSPKHARGNNAHNARARRLTAATRKAAL